MMFLMPNHIPFFDLDVSLHFSLRRRLGGELGRGGHRTGGVSLLLAHQSDAGGQHRTHDQDPQLLHPGHRVPLRPGGAHHVSR